jgi:hypothetical protein
MVSKISLAVGRAAGSADLRTQTDNRLMAGRTDRSTRRLSIHCCPFHFLTWSLVLSRLCFRYRCPSVCSRVCPSVGVICMRSPRPAGPQTAKLQNPPPAPAALDHVRDDLGALVRRHDFAHLAPVGALASHNLPQHDAETEDVDLCDTSFARALPPLCRQLLDGALPEPTPSTGLHASVPQSRAVGRTKIGNVYKGNHGYRLSVCTFSVQSFMSMSSGAAQSNVPWPLSFV